MPKFSSYAHTLAVMLAFAVQISLVSYFAYEREIKENWPKYRCNPAYWVFSNDVNRDFTHCAQNAQMNTLGFALQPITYMMSGLSSMGAGLSSDVNNIRASVGQTRTNTAGVVGQLFSVFSALVINMQKMSFGLKDMTAKMMGVVVTIINILDGSTKTMGSAWNGPTGQAVRSLSCFHPCTRVILRSGGVAKMKNLRTDDVLDDGSRVFAVMRIAVREPLYRIKGGGVNGSSIHVSGSHCVFDAYRGVFCPVKDSPNPDIELATDKRCDYYSCLITDTGRIRVGGYTFLDWEDDNVFSHRRSMLGNALCR